MLRTEWIDTPLGGMIVVTDDLALHLLELTGRRALGTKLRRLSAMVRAASVFVARQSQILRSRNWRGILLIGLPISACRWCCMAAHFFRVVWAMLREIPVGQTRSYGQTAQKIGRPDAVRAVAQANGANQIALMILCHRVVGADGALTGYGGGVWRKDRLIFLETQIAKRLHAHAHSI